MDPLHDECSGIAQLNACDRLHYIQTADALGWTLGIGMVAGALIVWAIVISFT